MRIKNSCAKDHSFYFIEPKMHRKLGIAAITFSMASTIVSAVSGADGSGAETPINMTQSEYTTEKKQMLADYNLAKLHCKRLTNNAKNICFAEASGAQKVGLAELEARYKGVADEPARRNVGLVKTEAAFRIAKEKCYDSIGNRDEQCFKMAENMKAKALEHFSAKSKSLTETIADGSAKR